ncbi:MAG: YbhB/YbcL family Raf kinase inhibitor-like protein [Acidobacteriota bacterium]
MLAIPHASAQAAPHTITVSSPVLKDGQPIPRDYTADGKNISPPITWSNLPAGTKELALVCEDPVAPTPQPFVHWVVYKIPPTAKGLPEGMPIDATTAMPADLAGTIQGMSGFRRPIWRGPAPPKPGVVHRYHFIVFALDAVLDLQPGLTKPQLLEAMKGHIIGQGQLVATYERTPPQ